VVRRLRLAITTCPANSRIAGPAAEPDIRLAEEALGVRFPPSYRLFLARCGAAVGDGLDLAGLFEDDTSAGPPLWNHVVRLTLRLRRAARGSLPPAYVAVSGDGCDCIHYIDTASHRPDGESPVVAMGPGAEAVTIADSFADYVIRRSRS